MNDRIRKMTVEDFDNCGNIDITPEPSKYTLAMQRLCSVKTPDDVLDTEEYQLQREADIQLMSGLKPAKVVDMDLSNSYVHSV